MQNALYSVCWSESLRPKTEEDSEQHWKSSNNTAALTITYGVIKMRNVDVLMQADRHWRPLTKGKKHLHEYLETIVVECIIYDKIAGEADETTSLIASGRGNNTQK